MGDIALKKRSEVPAEYKWKLEDMFETDEQWEKEVEQTLLLIDEVSQFKGHLADNEIKFLKFLGTGGQDKLSSGEDNRIF